jgi:hypothetical protein
VHLPQLLEYFYRLTKFWGMSRSSSCLDELTNENFGSRVTPLDELILIVQYFLLSITCKHFIPYWSHKSIPTCFSFLSLSYPAWSYWNRRTKSSVSFSSFIAQLSGSGSNLRLSDACSCLLLRTMGLNFVLCSTYSLFPFAPDWYMYLLSTAI